MQDAASPTERARTVGRDVSLARWCLGALTLAASFPAYWWAIAETAVAAFDGAAERWRAQGYAVGYATPEVSGFPGAVRMVVPSPHVVAPAVAWEWRAESVTFAIDPWSPWQVKVELPGVHRWALPLPPSESSPVRHPFVVAAPAASGALRIGTSGDIARWWIATSDAELTMPNGTVVHIGKARLAIEQHAVPSDSQRPRTGTLRFDLSAETLVLPRARSAHVLGAAGDLLGSQFDLIAAAGEVVEPAGLAAAILARMNGTKASIELASWRVAGGRVDVTAFRLSTPEVDCRARGTVAIDTSLRPVGELSAVLRGHDRVIDALVRSGHARGEDGAIAKVILGLLVRPAPDGGPPVLEVPVVAADGVLFAGPIPLLALPPLAPP